MSVWLLSHFLQTIGTVLLSYADIITKDFPNHCSKEKVVRVLTVCICVSVCACVCMCVRVCVHTISGKCGVTELNPGIGIHMFN